MSELPTGAYASGQHSDQNSSKAAQVAAEGKQAAGQAVSEVKDTAAEQVRRVGQEAGAQARNVAGEVRDKLGEHARAQNDKLVSGIRETADHLDEMRGDRSGTPAAAVVSRVAEGGRQLADYLDRNGPEGVLAEVQDFARRRPGAFLATALAAGFVVGRLGKSVAKADEATGGKPAGDAYSSVTPSTAPTSSFATTTSTDYASATGAGADYVGTGNEYASTTGAGADYVGTGTGYAATTGAGADYLSTGTGTPIPVQEEYPIGTREPRP
ncbi:hypothetical protein ACWT_4862 [Actinoplanes sp. SE50]|uniref:hypothetical protein n=1 Tax=unclassified Actinoplanes TaxID=2626549 RepID=UPI00023EC4D1|nr:MULTISPECIES: hypothetical protein [unclassified Actinoplanes]AEV85881.1 hypothetical protein ACPL_4992 [Actinoplanes sp. SE50/110]ATO84277.1 hypothetical protein ACWT_4862 [Actinoplanes sp. SE50]SLM01687.1 uncharacterized protein ACSP50_4923 [Actinoplanes sp. SE50/110]